MREDVQALIREFGVATFGYKQDIAKVEKMIRPEEKLYFIAPIQVGFRLEQPGDEASEIFWPGIVAITNQRVFFVEVVAEAGAPSPAEARMREFDLSLLYGVDSKGALVTFYSGGERIRFKHNGTKDVTVRIRKALERTIEQAPRKATPPKGAKRAAFTQRVTCSRCGVVNTLIKGQVAVCRKCQELLL